MWRSALIRRKWDRRVIIIIYFNLIKNRALVGLIGGAEQKRLSGGWYLPPEKHFETIILELWNNSQQTDKK